MTRICDLQRVRIAGYSASSLWPLNAQSLIDRHVESIEGMREALDRREAIFVRLALDQAAGLAH